MPTARAPRRAVAMKLKEGIVDVVVVVGEDPVNGLVRWKR